MKFFLAAIFLCVACLGLVEAYNVEGQITTTQELTPDFTKTRVVLNDGLYTAYVNSMGHFEIEDVPAGVYHLDVYEPKLKFRKYKIDVSSKKGGTFRALSKPFAGGEKKMESYPLKIEAIGPEVYFRPRTGANPVAMIFRNPIFLIMGVFFLMRMFAPTNPEDEKPAGSPGGSGGEAAVAQASNDDDDDVPPGLEETKQQNTRRRRGKHD